MDPGLQGPSVTPSSGSSTSVLFLFPRQPPVEVGKGGRTGGRTGPGSRRDTRLMTFSLSVMEDCQVRDRVPVYDLHLGPMFRPPSNLGLESREFRVQSKEYRGHNHTLCPLVLEDSQ